MSPRNSPTAPRDAFSQGYGQAARSIRAYQQSADAPKFESEAVAQLDPAPSSPDAGAFAVAAWFLGTKGENAAEFERLIVEAIRDHVHWRRNYHPSDPSFITYETKAHPAYRQAMGSLESAYMELLAQLKKSVPFFSMRYQGHMNWDLTLPGMLGYFATMLYNPNNVAFEGSVATTILEIIVGDDLCRMLGYRIPDAGDEAAGIETLPKGSSQKPADVDGRGMDELANRWSKLSQQQREWLLGRAVTDMRGASTQNHSVFTEGSCRAAADKAVRPWGHITCDGTIANIEAMWSGRNLKFYPIALQAALREQDSPLAPAIGLEVVTCDGGQGRLVDLEPWEVLNLDADVILELPERLGREFGVARDAVTAAVARHNIQNLGVVEFALRYLKEIEPAVVLVPGTKHYSFPKAAAALGLGSDNLIDVPVDLDGRQDLEALRKHLEEFLNRQQSVISVVAVMGTTEESAVDPLADILQLREQFRVRGLNFLVHADAAWGGYHASLLRTPAEMGDLPVASFEPPRPAPELTLNAHTRRQYEALGQADSVTVDPHKSGYIPYPAGALCYRNSAMRDLVTFSAPVIFRGGAEPTVGIYGMEGSKPGAAPAAVYLAHRVIRPHKEGYGRIIGQALFSCRRYYARLLGMARPEDPFVVVPVPRLPAERAGRGAKEIEAQRRMVIERIGQATNAQIRNDPEALALLEEIGPDQNILGYAFSLKKINNRSELALRQVNALNKGIYDRLSIDPGHDIYGYNMLVSTTDLGRANYGSAFIDDYRRRLGVTDAASADDAITILRSVVMDPWVTETTRGSFLDVLEAELRKVVMDAIETIQPTRMRGY